MTYPACKIEGCDRPAGGRGNSAGMGWCSTHYARYRRHGDPLHGGAVIRQHATGVPCEFCRKPAVARGMCENHYRRWKRCGDPFGGNTPHGLRPVDRFWAKVDKTSECWIWTGTVNSAGYGTFSATGSSFMAHRYAWLLAGNDLTPGLQLDHLCRERTCVRPDHLEQVTAAENLARAREANRERDGLGVRS